MKKAKVDVSDSDYPLFLRFVRLNHYIVKGENSEDGVRFIIYRKTKKQKKKKENNWVKNKRRKSMMNVATIGSGVIVERMIEVMRLDGRYNLYCVYSRTKKRAKDLPKNMIQKVLHGYGRNVE